MAIIKYKPTSPGRRFQTVAKSKEINSENNPQKSLLTFFKKKGGRNVYGRVTSRHIGGGHKRKFRIIDFKRKKVEIPGKVANIEYDPNRSSNIALINYVDGEKKYILAPAGLKIGDIIFSANFTEIKIGNCMPIKNIPLGSAIHNVELKIGKGAQLIRSAGTFGQIMAKEGNYAQVKLPSGEVRKIHLECRATLGQIGNIDHENISYGKAGKTRWFGRRPKVRGVVMNPVDHPMGGGEGKTSGGRHPVTPWGKPTKGYKTRKNKSTDKYILRKRGSK